MEEDEEEEDQSPPEVSMANHQGPVFSVQPKPTTPLPVAQRPGLKPLTLATLASLNDRHTPSICSASWSNGGCAEAPELVVVQANEGCFLAKLFTFYHMLPQCLTHPGNDSSNIGAAPSPPANKLFSTTIMFPLLARITELERVLTVRTRSPSVASSSSRQLSISSVVSEQPSDEMLCLVRDLKAERDDLTRDICVYQTQMEQMERQIVTLTRRVENERCDAWQARERMGVLEVEKKQLSHALERANVEMAQLRESLQQAQESEERCRTLLAREEKRRVAAEQQLEKRLPEAPVVRFTVPSIAVGSGVPSTSITNSNSDNELAHYEDEEEEDAAPLFR